MATLLRKISFRMVQIIKSETLTSIYLGYSRKFCIPNLNILNIIIAHSNLNNTKKIQLEDFF